MSDESLQIAVASEGAGPASAIHDGVSSENGGDSSLVAEGDSAHAPELSSVDSGVPEEPLLVFPRVLRHPNLGDAAIFILLLVIGLLMAAGLFGIALHFHWFGLKSASDAENRADVTLVTQLLMYLMGLGCAVPVFETNWGQGYLAGLHFHAATAYRLRYWLVGIAFLCNVMVMVANAVLPFPEHAPIDKMFSTSLDAWLMMAFGITVAPFFEEMIFRGFLVPAVATAWDWSYERMTGALPRPLDGEGNPVWSPAAMIFSTLLVSAPFAYIHAAQVGQAWAPVLLLYCVSLVLCTVRLVTRSLAASTLVHSAYNFMLFAMMLVETGGFRHMDKM